MSATSWFYHYQLPKPDSVDPCYYCGAVNVPGDLCEVTQKEDHGQYIFPFVETVDVQFMCEKCFRSEIESQRMEEEYYTSLQQGE